MAPAADSTRQRELFERIHDAYASHYYDRDSMEFRRRFIHGPLWDGLDLDGKEVADLACGSGANSEALLERFPGVRTTGFDISEPAVVDYAKRTGRPSHRVNLTEAGSFEADFDAAMFIGALHHCVSDLRATLANVAAMLRPGGVFMMMEPNQQYVLDHARRAWYRNDAYFDAQTERALSHDELVALSREWFDVEWVRWVGGPAYFLVYNSLIFRIPHPVKRATAPALLRLEASWNKLPGKVIYPYFLARWRRR